jgi:hypothetical protein
VHGRIIAASLIILTISCKQIPYGDFLPKGMEVKTHTFRITVPQDYLRVSLDYPVPGDILMYEDYGGGMRGATFLAQSRPGRLETGALRQFESFSSEVGPPIELAEIRREMIVSDPETIHYLLAIPADEEKIGNGWLVRRQEIHLLGAFFGDNGRVYRVEVGWNPSVTHGPHAIENQSAEFTRHQRMLSQLIESLCIYSQSGSCMNLTESLPVDILGQNTP